MLLASVALIGGGAGAFYYLYTKKFPGGFNPNFSALGVEMDKGTSASITCRVTQTHGTAKPVSFVFTPINGITVSANPPIATPNFTATLTITVPPTCPVGSYDVKTEILSSDAQWKGWITVHVTSPTPPSSVISASVNVQNPSVAQGTFVTVNVSVDQISGVAKSTRLSLTNMPTGLTASFAPGSGTPPFNSILSISADPLMTVGGYDVNVLVQNDEMAVNVPMIIRVLPRATTPTTGELVVMAYAPDAYLYNNPCIAHITVNPSNLTGDTTTGDQPPLTFPNLIEGTYTVLAILGSQMQSVPAIIKVGVTTIVRFQFEG